MRLSLPKLFAASLTALAVSACDDTTAPVPQKLVNVLLDFCSNDTPVWFAFQAEGGQWTQLSPNTEGTYSFQANNHTALAFVRQSGGDYRTEIIYATSTDLEKISGQACLEEGGTKQVNGTIAGLGVAQSAFVTMNFSSVKLDPPQASFSLVQLAERPLDVVASRANVTATTQSADRIIIRRSRNFVNNASMPVLDFASAEALIPTTFTTTISGLGAGETTLLQNNFFSQLETSQTLFALAGVANGSTSVVGVPATTLAAGDYHDLFAFGVTATGIVRGSERFFHAPSNQTLALSGTLAAPLVTTLGTTPYVRLRAELARQSEYGGAMNVEYSQQHSNFTVTTVSLSATEAYFDAHRWVVDIPDLSNVAGWQNSWGLISGGGAIDWNVSAHSGRPELIFGAKPNDGETVNFSSRASSTSAIQAFTSGLATVRRPRPFARAR